MLRQFEKLRFYELLTMDGKIGTVEDFYFDDKYWTIRYLVTSTVNWLPGRQVLISPRAITTVNEGVRTISVDLTQKQIKDSPSLDSDKPVSRQFEEAYHNYYGWTNYWSGPDVWGSHPYIVRGREDRSRIAQGGKAWDPHLRSAHIVSGYFIQAEDGEIGHVEDFIIDEETWTIRYLAIDTRNWWPGKKVLVSPKWIERISWGESKVFLNLSREEIKKSPEYKEGSLPSREYEAGLHKHYDRKGYWED